LPEQLSSLGDCPSTFLRSEIARAAFVTRGLPEYLSSLGDYPSGFHRSGIARAVFFAQGLPEQLSSLGAGASNFFNGYFLLPSDYLILPGFMSVIIHQMVSTSAKR
jgi:hypothetical protein